MPKRPLHRARRERNAPHPAPKREPVWTLPSPLPKAFAPTPAFLASAASAGIEFEPGDLDRLGLYLALLLDANRSFNLTGVRDAGEAWTRHIADSLTLLPMLAELPEGAGVIDVGSGGGLPGIPLAITLPHLRFTLLEATGKKVEFLSAVAGALGLKNVRVIQDRAERLAHDRGEKISDPAAPGRSARPNAHRENYDAAVARAVGKLAVIAELTVPFVKIGGLTLLIKGQQADTELAEAAAALKALNAVYASTLDTPTGKVVALEKNSATPRQYPRRDGEPARSPLK